MSDLHGDPLRPAEHSPASGFDGELDVKWIVLSGAGALGVTIVSALLVWWLILGFTSLENAQDAPPSALPEAAERSLPPAPRLELSPPENLKELRQREDLALAHPAWIDESEGTLRLPIDLALDVVARRGLGEVPPAVPAPETATAPAAPALAAPTAPTAPSGGAN